jgi:hypothetical protein
MWFTAFIQRCLFYFAWNLADLVCITSGLGFNGYDSSGKARWDLLTNFSFVNIEVLNKGNSRQYYSTNDGFTHMFGFQFATSIKMILDSWNMQTQRWLKFVCFERLAKFKTFGVFILTILWHGLETRFLFSFISTAINVFANRSVRNSEEKNC